MQLSRHIEKTLSSSEIDTVYNLNILKSVWCQRQQRGGRGRRGQKLPNFWMSPYVILHVLHAWIWINTVTTVVIHRKPQKICTITFLVQCPLRQKAHFRTIKLNEFIILEVAWKKYKKWSKWTKSSIFGCHIYLVFYKAHSRVQAASYFFIPQVEATQIQGVPFYFLIFWTAGVTIIYCIVGNIMRPILQHDLEYNATIVAISCL